MCDTCRRTGTRGTVPENLPTTIDAELEDVRLLALDEEASITLDDALRLEGATAPTIEPPTLMLGSDDEMYLQIRVAIRDLTDAGGGPRAFPAHPALERTEDGLLTDAERARLRRQSAWRRFVYPQEQRGRHRHHGDPHPLDRGATLSALEREGGHA